MDIYAEITNRIISEMESGIIPWPSLGSPLAAAYHMRRASRIAF